MSYKNITFFVVLSALQGAVSLKAEGCSGASSGKHCPVQKTLSLLQESSEHVPHYTANPKEAGLDDATLDKSVIETVQTHSSAKLVKESEQQRGKHFKIHEDPMVLFSKELSQDPLALLSKYYRNCKEVPLTGEEVKTETETHTCEETGDPYLLTCTKDLHVHVETTPPQAATFGFYLPLLWGRHRGF